MGCSCLMLLFFVLFLSSSLCNTLELSFSQLSTNNQTNITTITLPSFYATVGDEPSTLQSHPLFIMHDDLCNPGDLTGKVLVFTGDLLLSMFSDCNNAHQGNGVVLARIAQKYGAAGVIYKAFHDFQDGRVVGFSSSIKIPVVAITKESLETILSPNVHNLSVVLPLKDKKDVQRVQYLRNLWQAGKITTSIIYGVLTLIVGYLLYHDLIKCKRRGYKITNNLVMKCIALYSMIVSLLWVTVDPFGFDGLMWCKNSMLINLQFSSVVIVLSFILLMWIKAVGKMNFNSKTKIAIFIYVFCAVLWVISFGFGFVWYNNITNNIYSRGITVIFVILAISYCVVGKDMVQALYSARSVSSSNVRLIIKLSLFIGWYVCIAIGVAVVYSVGILGAIFELLLTIFFEGLVLLGTFLILFFQPFKRKRQGTKDPQKPNSTDKQFISL